MYSVQLGTITVIYCSMYYVQPGTVTATVLCTVHPQSLQHVQFTARYSCSHCNMFSQVQSRLLQHVYSQAQLLQHGQCTARCSHYNLDSVQLGTVAIIATCTARYNPGRCNMCTARHSHCNMHSVQPGAVTTTCAAVQLGTVIAACTMWSQAQLHETVQCTSRCCHCSVCTAMVEHIVAAVPSFSLRSTDHCGASHFPLSHTDHFNHQLLMLMHHNFTITLTC